MAIVGIASSAPTAPRPLRSHWGGHVFLFDKKAAAPTYAEFTGARLLLLPVALEAFRLTINLLRIPFIPFWIQAPLCLILALFAVRSIAGLTWREVGLRPWREWNLPEKSYFIQILIIANVVFTIVFATRLRAIVGGSSAATILLTVFVPYLFLGFYQEVVYRGMLQTELIGRWGAVIGIIVSNALYTFGPLHYYYFASQASLGVPMFAAIFSMGLVFAMIYRRSGNLWIIAIMHALGNAYIVVGAGRIR